MLLLRAVGVPRRVRILATTTAFALGATALAGVVGNAGAALARGNTETAAAATTYRVTMYLPTKASTAKRTFKVTFSPRKPTKVRLQVKKNGRFVTIKTKQSPSGSATTFTYDPPNSRTTTTRMRVLAIWRTSKVVTPGRTTKWSPVTTRTPAPPTTGTRAPVGALDANGNPTVNLGEPASLNACWSYGPTDSRCVTAAVQAINTGRAREGLRAFTLPANWYSLTRPQQMLVISNDERSARGLRTITRLSDSLNHIAMEGAATNDDPVLAGWTVEGNRTAYGWAGNWAITPGGPLYANYLWMYDDGPGSGNIDCTSTRTNGCWGHRRNILAYGAADSSTSLILGAAETTTTYSGWTGLSDATILVKVGN